MRLSKGLTACGFVGVVALAWLWAYGCDERATQPWPPPDKPKDYVVYMGDGGTDPEYFGYHVASGRIDTLTLPTYYWGGVFVSADGTRLFSVEHTQVAVFDLATYELVAELPYSAGRGIYFSVDGRHMVLSGSMGNGLYLLDAEEYTLLFHDSTAVLHGGCFSLDGDRFYAASDDTLALVYLLDLENNYTATYCTLPGDNYLLHMLPSPDESKWLLYRRLSYYLDRFEVYDVRTDAVIFRDHLYPGYGEMVVTADGQFVFYTQPGPPQRDMNGPPYFTVFDVRHNRIDRLVSVTGMIDGIHPEYLPLGELAITPDGRWLVAGGFDPTDCFVVYDIVSMRLITYVQIPNNNLMSYTCQTGL